MTDTATNLDVDTTERSTFLTELAIRPLLRPAGDATPTCGLCGDQLTRLGVTVEHHELAVLVCSACSWHTRLIDGRLATTDDLLTIAQDPGSSYPRPPRAADAVTWYRRTNEYRGR